jgi:hypothetical protein
MELAEGRLHSEELGLDLVMEGERLRLYDPAAGEYLRTYSEAGAERRAERERQRADAAEAMLAQLRAELESLRQQQGASAE